VLLVVWVCFESSFGVGCLLSLLILKRPGNGVLLLSPSPSFCDLIGCMANVALGIGAALIVLGIGSYFGSAQQSLTALIPAAFGVVLAILGALARDPGKRKMAMHIAVVVGILGFFGSARGLIGLAQMIAGDSVPRPNAVIAQAIMAVLLLIFVILCVRSFIDARRNRSMEAL
jgi:hypothetical protein